MSEMEESCALNFLLNELAMGVMVIGCDDGIVKYANHRACTDLGKTPSETIGMHHREIFWPEFFSVYDQLQEECCDGKEHTLAYYWAEMQMWEEVWARIIRWDSSRCIMMSVMNINESARLEYKCKNLLYFDALLKLPNGAKLEEDINKIANLETVALIIVGIERLDDINDLYGWENGDNLLKQIRDWILSSELRYTQLYRVNNSFVMLGRQVTLEDTKKRSEEIIRRFAKPWFVSTGGNGLLLYCRVRVGIVYGKYIRNEMRNLLRRTLCAIENEGSSCYAIYDEESDQEAKRSVMLRDTLVNSIFSDMRGFTVCYQPVVSVQTGEWVAVEALCRWRTPEGKMVSPEEFICIAEQLHVIDHIDRWVRKTALNECATLQLNKKNFALHVNFSAVGRVSDAFIENFLRMLDETHFPPEKVKLEITESARMKLDDDNLKGLQRLQENHILISLDDFGTGYSSFANLIKISPNEIKIDKLFLDGIEKDDYRQYLLQSIVNIAHYLKIHVVAEGIEKQEQFYLLKKYNVELAQGYLFSKPLSYEQLERESKRFQ